MKTSAIFTPAALRIVYAVCALAIWIAAFTALRSVVPVGGVVDMRLDTAQAGVAKWYLNRGSGYTEADSVSVTLHPGSNDVRFRLPSATYTGLRFDPIDNSATVTVRIMNWHVASEHAGFAPNPHSLVPLENIASLSPSPDSQGVIAVPTAGTDDPQLSLPLNGPLQLEPMRSVARDALAAALLSAFIVLLMYVAYRMRTRTLIVTGLFLVGGLIIGLACTSRIGTAHPDERAHAFVFEYLTEHVLPPAVDDPGTRWTLSTFGYSYLFELNVTYWVAARVMAPLASLFTAPENAARVFQCGLWLVLACIALRRRRATIALGVLFLSPQMWYVFAYFNGDAFPLLLAFLTVLLTAPDAGAHAYIDGRSPMRAAFGLAVCLGLLLVSKANYLPLVPGLLLWLAVVHMELRISALCAAFGGLALLGARVFMAGSPAFANTAMMTVFGAVAIVLLLFAIVVTVHRCWRDVILRSRLMRLTALLLLTVAVAAPRVAQDLYVNGLPSTKAARIEAVEEANARADLRPSIIAQGHGGEGTGLVLQHVGLATMLFGPHYAWVARSTTTALGVYGYLNILAPSGMYQVLLIIVLLCAGIAAFALRNAEPTRYARLLIVAAGTAFLVIESSALHSWIDAFQPQGRYLFPLFAMLALIVAYSERKLPRTAFRMLLATSLAVSTASFAFVALPAFGVGN